jgi:phosphoenolpyruvate carboxylase
VTLSRVRSGCSAPCWDRSSIEQAGQDTYEAVEAHPRRAIALRGSEDPDDRERQAADLDALDLAATEAVVTAFSIYFQLVNLAEARGRIRALRRRERTARDGLLDDSVAEAVVRLRRSGHDEAELDAMLAGLRISPVLTAHPTEARRRTALVALRRCAILLARLDDPRSRRPRTARSGVVPARGDHAPVADVGPAYRSRPKPLD